MIALSVELPGDPPIASPDVARRLGVSGSELIRQALVHEIEQARGVERRAVAESLRSMGSDRILWRTTGPGRLMEGLIRGGIYTEHT